MLAIVRNRAWFYAASGTLVALSIGALAIWGLRPGIDFTGGSILEARFDGELPDKSAVEEVFTEAGQGGIKVQALGEHAYLARLPFIDEAAHHELTARMSERFGERWHEDRFETVGPSISAELREKTFTAIALVVVAIVLYVAWAFRSVSEPVRSWKYGLCAILALIHDVLIPTGVFAILGRFMGIEVDILFVTALLTILGLSVNDTIVTFDRIRENLLKRKHDAFEVVVNDSVNQTIRRSVNTSFSTLLALSAVLAFGGDTTRNFILTLMIGVVVGTYSSIFLASPLLVSWFKRGR